MVMVRISALVWQEAKAQQQDGKSIVRQLTWLRIVFRCPSRYCNPSIHFELNLSIYRCQKYYKGAESLGKGLTVVNVLSRESTILPSGKQGAMQRLCCSQHLPSVVGWEHESCKHQGLHHHLPYSDLLTSLCPALLKRSGKERGAVPRSSKQTTHAAALELHPSLCEATLAKKTCY